MCIKSNNSTYFKMVLQSNYLYSILHLCQKSSNVDEFVADWYKCGLTPPQAPRPTQTQAPRPVFNQPAPIAKPIDRSVEKLKKDLLVVKETIKSLDQLIKNSKSKADVSKPEFQTTVCNLKEMSLRIMKMIDFIPPENILLELLQRNDDIQDCLIRFEEYKKSGNKSEIPSELFKEEPKSNSLEELFGTIKPTTTHPKLQDPIEKEFASISIRDSKKDDFAEISNRKPNIDVNKLFENSPVKPSPTVPSAPREEEIKGQEDLDLFQSIANRNKDKSQNYNDFQNFLKSKKETSKNPFE